MESKNLLIVFILFGFLGVSSAAWYDTNYEYRHNISQVNTSQGLLGPLNGTSPINELFDQNNHWIYGTWRGENSEFLNIYHQDKVGGGWNDTKIVNGTAEFCVIQTLPTNYTSCSLPPEGLQSYYTLDETGGKAWDHIGNEHGGLNGNLNQGLSGKVGKAYGFDGNDDYISTTTDIIETDPYTISLWVNADTINDDDYIINTWQTKNPDKGFVLKTTSNNFRFIKRTSKNKDRIVETSATANSWTHVVARYNLTHISIYRNGLEKGSTTFGTPNNATSDLAIGRRSGANELFFDGRLDSLRVYNRAISENEIEALYHQKASLGGKENIDKPEINSKSSSPNPVKAPNPVEIKVNVSDRRNNLEKVQFNLTGPNGELREENLSMTNDTSIIEQWSYSFEPAEQRSNEGIWKADLTAKDSNGYKTTGNLEFEVDTDWFDQDFEFRRKIIQDNISTEMVGSLNGFNAINGTDNLNHWIYGTWNGRNSETIHLYRENETEGGFNKTVVANQTREYCRIQTLPGANSSSCPNPPNELIAFYPLDQDDNKAWDYIGQNHGSLINFEGDEQASIAKIGRSYDFDGTDDYIDLGTGAPFDDKSLGSSLFLGAWFKTTSEKTQLISGKGLQNENDSYYLQIDDHDRDGNHELRGYIETNTSTFLNSDIQPADGNWHFAAISYNGSKFNLYFDGKKVNSSNQSGNLADASASSFTIGSRGTDWFFNGKIDHVRVYNRSLSDDEVSALYHKNAKISSDESQSGNRIDKVETYEKYKPRSFFEEDDNVTLRALGDFETIPSISIIDSDGGKLVENQDMTNISSDVFEYNYSINNSRGWHDIKINENWENIFYIGNTWENNYTDYKGRDYSFKREINVTEPDTSERWFEPIDRHINFRFGPNNESVRVLYYNGSNMIEIPSQIYNTSLNGEEVESANVVFLSSLEKGETRTYYLLSSKANISESYGGVNNTKSNLDEGFENALFEGSFNGSLGYLLRDVRNKLGSGESLSGVEPIDRYPQVNIPSGLETNTKKARIDSTAEINITRGPLVSNFQVDGDLDGDTDFPYSVDCTVYASTSYMLCEKNVSTKNSETWENFYLNGLVFEDGIFTHSSFRNSTGDVSVREIGSGDNKDTIGIDEGLEWLSFYNNRTGDAAAELFLNKNFGPTDSPNFRIEDNSNNDFYRHTLISDSSEVSSGDFYYTKTARMFYHGRRGWQVVNETYNQLKNPLLLAEGVEKTNDKFSPNYSSVGNISSDDKSDANIHSLWKDDTLLDRFKIKVTGKGEEGANSTIYTEKEEIRDSGSLTNSSWVNTTISSDKLNAGQINASITVFDVSNKSNSTNLTFNLTDITAPEFENITNDPDNKAKLDPENKIDIQTNLTEYSNVSEVNLYYKNKTDERFNQVSMSSQNIEEFKYTFDASFTPEFQNNYSYRIEAVDTKGNSRNSSTKNLEVKYDRTWSLETSLQNNSGTFSTNVTAGSFLLNNTGDFNLTFDMDTGVFNSRTWVNGSQLPQTAEVAKNSSKLFDINATTRDDSSTEGIDILNLTVENPSGSPKQESSIFDVTTSTGGPFLSTEITEYNSTVYRGDSGIVLEGKVTNKGNETAQNVEISFELPSGWNFSSGNSSTSDKTLNLDVGVSKTFSTEVGVSDDANTGDVNIVARSTSDEDSRNSSETVRVIQESPTKIIEEDSSDSSSGGGGGGGGGGSYINNESGLTEDQQSRLFQTSSTYYLVRGGKQEFQMKVENPFDEGSLEDVRLDIEGLLSNYISIEPAEINKIPFNSSANFTISLEAPKYFSRTTKGLNFTITGTNNRTDVRGSGSNTTVFFKEPREMREQRTVNLVIHEISKENASKMLNSSRSMINDLETQNFSVQRLESLFTSAEDSFEHKEYYKVEEIYKEIKNQKKKAKESSKAIEKLEQSIKKAENNGIETQESKRTLQLAKAALQRGDYTTSASRAKEAEQVFALETKGEFNLLNFLKKNSTIILLGAGFLGLIGYLTFLKMRMILIKKKLLGLKKEEKTIHSLMKHAQRKCFEEETMSMEEYERTIQGYEEEMNENIKDIIRLEARKSNLLKIKGEMSSLKDEKQQIKELMKENQRRYLKEGKMESRVYEQKMNQLKERLSEIEGRIAEKTAEREIKNKENLFSKIKGEFNDFF